MYGIQSQERRYHYSGIAVPVCWNGGAIPAGIFTCVEIRMFAIQRAFRRHGDPTRNYSEIFFNLVLMNLYYMATHSIGFKAIFLNSNHEGRRLC